MTEFGLPGCEAPRGRATPYRRPIGAFVHAQKRNIRENAKRTQKTMKGDERIWKNFVGQQILSAPFIPFHP